MRNEELEREYKILNIEYPMLNDEVEERLKA
jgi:hypothetical protein